MGIKKKLKMLSVFICLALTLCACGVSDADRAKLYQAVIKTGDLQLSAKVDEYENKLNVSYAPVPGGTCYYIYRGDNGEKYRFDYQKIRSKEHPYRVIVEAEYQSLSNGESGEGDIAAPEKTITYRYEFNKSRLLNLMKLEESVITGYVQRFDENESVNKSGISNFSIINGEVNIHFEQKNVDERIVEYIEAYHSGARKGIEIVVGTKQCEYKAGEIIYAKNDGHGGYVIAADIDAEGIPEWVSVGDVKIRF